MPLRRKWGQPETDLQENTYNGVSGLPLSNLSSPSTSASWGEN